MKFGARQSIKLLRSQKAGSLIGGLMMIIGIGALLYAGKVTLDERRVRNWVPHSAQIENARVSSHENDKGVKSYSIDVAYVFEWKGTSFKGTKYRLHDKPSSNFEESRNVVQDLLISKQDGGQYPIFVDPKNPARSSVLNEVHPEAKSSSLFLGFLFSILGYFTMFKPKLFRRRSKGE